MLTVKKQILGIDASRSSIEKPTGVERYSSEIIQAILKESKDFDIKLYTPREIVFLPHEKQIVIPFKRLWTLVRLSFEMLMKKPDILFVPSHVIPFFCPKRTFTTIHDIAFKKYPSAYRPMQRYYLDFAAKRAVTCAEKIIVPSQVVKNDLINIYKVPREKIRVIYHGKINLEPVHNKERYLKKFGLKKRDKFFLYVGRLEKKKNIDTLVEAFELVQKIYSNVKLVLAGSQSPGFKDLFKKNLVCAGYISEKELTSLLYYSSALILPSKEEGFGMPVLQAFESETPVICSYIPALKEVAGDAALFVNPDRAEEFAKAMIRILEEDDLAKNMVKAGRKRLGNFSWSKNAKILLELFQ